MHIYEELGLKPLINAFGANTKIGGTLMAPEVIDAMREASEHYVELADLLKVCGKRVAELLQVPDAHITSGAAAGLCVATAACMAGTDKARIYQLPDATGLKNEVLIHRTHRNVYDQAIRTAGASLVEFCYADKVEIWQLEKAITEKTAALVYFAMFEDVCSRGTLPLAEICSVCKKHNIPVIVDAAAELPPSHNFRGYLDQGADLVIFSGGKDICGPQGTGLIIGQSELIAACARNSNPNYSIGRPFKVAKEEIVGITKAVELYVKRDFNQRMEIWERQARYMENSLLGIPGFKVTYVCPAEKHSVGRPHIVPRVNINPETSGLKRSMPEMVRKLKEGSPAIAVNSDPETIILNTQMLKEGEEKIVAAKVREVLLQYAPAEA